MHIWSVQIITALPKNQPSKDYAKFCSLICLRFIKIMPEKQFLLSLDLLQKLYIALECQVIQLFSRVSRLFYFQLCGKDSKVCSVKKRAGFSFYHAKEGYFLDASPPDCACISGSYKRDSSPNISCLISVLFGEEIYQPLQGPVLIPRYVAGVACLRVSLYIQNTQQSMEEA